MGTTLERAALLVASTFFSLVLAEVIVRVLDLPPYPMDPIPPSCCQLSENEAIGYEYRPDHALAHTGFTFNSEGFRDRAHAIEKPEETLRVIAIGDSTTAGNGVADANQLFTSLLESMLNREQHSRRHYEVFNMGVGGYQTLQEVETLRAKGLKYAPDLVLVTFCVNDFKLYGTIYATLQNAKLSGTGESGPTLYGRLLKRSRLAFISHYRLLASEPYFVQEYAKTVLKGRSPVEAGLALLSDLQSEHGFAVRILLLPTFRKPFEERKHKATYDKVVRIAEKLPGIEVIHLVDYFATLPGNSSDYAKDNLHMNPAGHRAMAEFLVPIVRTALVTERESPP